MIKNIIYIIYLLIPTYRQTLSTSFPEFNVSAPSATPLRLQIPSITPIYLPPITRRPTIIPFIQSNIPSTNPTLKPSNNPSTNPTLKPSNIPSTIPTLKPSNNPSTIPTLKPSNNPSTIPTLKPLNIPTTIPSTIPSEITHNSSYIICSPSYLPTMIQTLASHSSTSEINTSVPSSSPLNVQIINSKSESSSQSINIFDVNILYIILSISVLILLIICIISVRCIFLRITENIDLEKNKLMNENKKDNDTMSIDIDFNNFTSDMNYNNKNTDISIEKLSPSKIRLLIGQPICLKPYNQQNNWRRSGVADNSEALNSGNEMFQKEINNNPFQRNYNSFNNSSFKYNENENENDNMDWMTDDYDDSNWRRNGVEDNSELLNYGDTVGRVDDKNNLDDLWSRRQSKSDKLRRRSRSSLTDNITNIISEKSFHYDNEKNQSLLGKLFLSLSNKKSLKNNNCRRGGVADETDDDDDDEGIERDLQHLNYYISPNTHNLLLPPNKKLSITTSNPPSPYSSPPLSPMHIQLLQTLPTVSPEFNTSAPSATPLRLQIPPPPPPPPPLPINKQTLVSHYSSSEFNASELSATPLRLQNTKNLLIHSSSSDFIASVSSATQPRIQNNKPILSYYKN